MSLEIPVAPRNYVDDWGTPSVSGDVYGICERIHDIDPSLRIRDRHEPGDGGFRYIVSEMCKDGIERWVCGVNELDARLVTRIQRILAVDLKDRLDEADKADARFKQQEHDDKLDAMVEKIGGPMESLLYKCGFIDNRPVSYPTKGVAGPARGAGR